MRFPVFALLAAFLLFSGLLSSCTDAPDKNGNKTPDRDTSQAAQKSGERKEPLISDSAQGYDWPSPQAAMQAIADRVIEVTPFRYQMILQPKKEAFDFIEYVDFGRTYDKQDQGAAYAISSIMVPKDTAVTFQVSHNDALKIWIEGQKVYQKNNAGTASVNRQERDLQLPESFEVQLKKGANDVLVKSTHTGSKEWIFYLQPEGAKIERSPIRNIKIGLDSLPYIDEKVCEIAHWLVMGPFPSTQLSKSYPPEREFVVGKLYEYGNHDLAWELPKIEVYADAVNSHPLWGTYYNWNYHAGGVAWTMAHLGQMTGKQKYTDFANRYCDFIFETKPYIKYQIEKLKGYRSVNRFLFDTPLLDFTTAPSLPIVDRLIREGNQDFPRRQEYEAWSEKIKDYVMNEQLRLDGVFSRKTPKEYTTWVDDMFMSIPFLLHAAKESDKPAEKERLYNEAASQVLGFHQKVYNPEAKLYMHANYSKTDEKLPHWLRANGWGIWAISLTLENLPKDHPKYDRIMRIYKEHTASFVRYQDMETGFWHNLIDDSTTYLETSGTAILTNALAKGLNNGWLPKNQFMPHAKAGWKALKSVIDQKGNVYNICMGTMCSTDTEYYRHRPRVKNDSHGVLCVMAAGLELQELLGQQKP